MIRSSRTRPLRRLAAGDPAMWRRALPAAAVLTVLAGAALSAFVHPALGPLLLLAAFGAPFLLRSVDLAFAAAVAVIMLLPFGALPLNLGFNPTLLDLALGALYLIWIMRLIQRRQRQLIWPPLGMGLLIFLGILVAALMGGLVGGRPSNNQLRTFVELLMGGGLFFVVANLVPSGERVAKVYRMLVGLAAAAAVLGLALYLLPDAWQIRLLSLLSAVDYPGGPGVLRFLNDDPSRLQRATGTAIDPNSFGGMLALMAALALPQAVSARPLLPRRLAIAAGAVLTLALLATVSRGSLLGLAAGLGVIGLLRDRRALLVAALAAVGFLALAQALPWTAAYVDHFFAGLQNQDRATQMRWGEYRDAWRLIQRYPWLGVGFGSPRDVDLYRGVSSLYLIIAESSGLVGLGAFLGLMGAIALRLTAAWRRLPDGGLRALVLGCLAAEAAALTSGVFDHYYFTYPHAFALLWLVLGLGLCAARLGEAELRAAAAGRT
ncbi:MAG: O-antigen ligase family protein [Ardenticatenia bacterium]|nr:O-antigen ligase family protein [Ardenticatenia bacterium]